MLRKLALIISIAIPIVANSATFDTWTTNEFGSGNYILDVNEQATDGVFNFNLTVNPWNAEALGLFIDFGNFNFSSDPSSTLTNIIPVGKVSLYAFDTSSDDCGNGCNLNGLNPTLPNPDGQWELVFSLGGAGFDSIQTFSFTIGGLAGLNDTDIALVGIRAQQYCSGTELLPNGNCPGSDKSYYASTGGGGGGGGGGGTIPEPGTIALLGLGLLGMGMTRLNKKA